MGMLKTNKNKSGLGVFAGFHFNYLGDNEGQDICELPEKIHYLISYSTKSNFDIFIGGTQGNQMENKLDFSAPLEKTFIGATYHIYKKKWGSSVSVKKCDSSEFCNTTGLEFTLYSKSKYHPYISIKNDFFDSDKEHIETFSFGGMRQVNSNIIFWGCDLILNNGYELTKKKASFFIGFGREFF